MLVRVQMEGGKVPVESTPAALPVEPWERLYLGGPDQPFAVTEGEQIPLRAKYV